MGMVFNWTENIGGIGENTCCQHFLLFIKYFLNPLPDNKILDWSKFKQSAEDNFQFDENGRKFTKLVENTVSKGEIAHYEQFLLFPQCFQQACFPGASKVVIVWEWIKAYGSGLLKLGIVMEKHLTVLIYCYTIQKIL